MKKREKRQESGTPQRGPGPEDTAGDRARLWETECGAQMLPFAKNGFLELSQQGPCWISWAFCKCWDLAGSYH